MINLVASRRGFKHDHILKVDGNKTDLIRLEISYLKGSQRKGVLVTINPKTVEQGDGYTSESFLLYNQANISVWAKLLTRKSDKEVLRVAEKLDASVLAILTAYLESADNGREALKYAIEQAAL